MQAELICYRQRREIELMAKGYANLRGDCLMYWNNFNIIPNTTNDKDFLCDQIALANSILDTNSLATCITSQQMIPYSKIVYKNNKITINSNSLTVC